MSDERVREALRSDARFVVIEAPAGCGKTHQAADYARDVLGAGTKRPLILTHTHAACSVFAERTKGAGAGIEIRTIDSLVASIGAAYHVGLSLPRDVTTWVRGEKEGHAKLAVKVARLLERHPMIAAAAARRHEIVICDEHQDASGDQHSIVMSLLQHGARLRVFADPMQRIFKATKLAEAKPQWEWSQLSESAQALEKLATAHRWRSGCAALGEWTLKARATLYSGGKIDLRGGLPDSVRVTCAENTAQKYGAYQLSASDRRPVDALVNASTSLLVS